MHKTFGRAEPNAAAASFNFCRAADVPKIDAAAAGGSFHTSGTLFDFYTATPGFKHRALQSGNQDDATAAALSVDLAFRRANLDAAPAGVEVEVTADVANINGSAAGFGINCATDIIHMNAAATALSIGSSCDTRCGHAAALGFHLHPLHLAGDIDHELAGKSLGTAALPVADDPGGISPDIGADLV